ncbi:hypothetical protein HQ584_05385 [Patescibacteria group bacterium]|nr:hypothetical protein [Patescibacteria group bacterium]
MRKEDLLGKREGEASSSIRKRVNKARDIRLSRFKGKSIYCNSQMSQRQIKKFCSPQKEAEKLLRSAISELYLSARAYYRILKISRTIADLDGKKEVKSSHLSEALQYRYLDRQLWRR